MFLAAPTGRVAADIHYPNFGRSKRHCQLKGCIFLLPAVWLALAGCGRQAPPAIETLHSQLLRDACDAFLAGDMARSRRALERLGEARPGDAFAAAARGRVEHHAALLQINDAIREGRVEDARRSVREATGAAFSAAAQTGPPVDALVAFKQYLGGRPFASVEAAEAALRLLNPHRPLLDLSPAFLAFIQGETAALTGLRTREEEVVVECLVGELDAAAVSGAPLVAERLAHLAALRPQHPLVQTWAAAWVSDMRALNQLSALTGKDPVSRRAFEAGVCLAWPQLSAAAWRAVSDPLALGQPAGLSGQLLQAAAAASAGQYDAAVRNLHALAAQTTIEPQHVARLLSLFVVSPRQAEAWCWRTPCPGVADVLGCIVQLRTSQPRP
jgi:hypothetical protein